MNIFTRLFRVKSKVTIYYDNRGEALEAVGNIGQTRANRGAFRLLRGQNNLPFGYKLRRFLRRLGKESYRTAEKAALYMDYTYRGETPPLTAGEMCRVNVQPEEKVIVLGASRST